MYSQNNEEEIVLKYFGDHIGRLIDIGAFDGQSFSNTRALLEHGWSGVMIEPSPPAFTALLKTMAEFGDRVTLINAAITENGGPVEFYDASGDAVSTLSKAHREKWKSAVKMHPIWINSLPASWLWLTFAEATFINLDVEDCNWDIFRGFPFDWPSLRLICVEHDQRDNEMQALAAPHGFQRLARNAENLILVR